MANTHPDNKEYKRRIWAWTMYDWANSAFATTILAAVLPIYYSQVAGATLSSPAKATAYWTTGLSISTLIVAIISPILGTISDVMRGKKLFLSVFVGLGVLGTGLLVLVSTGDWLLASLLFVFGRIGFNGANVFYDALLPHVAREEDRDVVSARGYAMGYLGGGLLLAVNIAMIQLLPGTWGARLSFFSVAVWWLVFSIPIFRRVPEPLAATAKFEAGETILSTSFKRLRQTFKDMRQYKELFKFLIAFLIYADGIGTIIEVAAIYGAELGLGSTELILALLLVQFVGIPYSLIFGRLPSPNEKRRPYFLAFIIFNLVVLPTVGIVGRVSLPSAITGTVPAPYASTATVLGEGLYTASNPMIEYSGSWQAETVTAKDMGSESDVVYQTAALPEARLDIPFNGEEILITYNMGPDGGTWQLLLDGTVMLDTETNAPLLIDTYNPKPRFEEEFSITAETPGEHLLSLISLKVSNPASGGNRTAISSIQVLPQARQSSLVLIIGMIAVVELAGVLFAIITGKLLFSKIVLRLDTKYSILLGLCVYSVISVWGFFLNSVIEFWFLAWLVAIVQGGSQALSRSLFSVMAPSTKSGEFFGLFGVMEKFSAILGPLVFAFAATTFGSSRPAILSIITFFIIGGVLLSRVNVDEGRRVAQAEDARLLRQSTEG